MIGHEKDKDIDGSKMKVDAVLLLSCVRPILRRERCDGAKLR